MFEMRGLFAFRRLYGRGMGLLLFLALSLATPLRATQDLEEPSNSFKEAKQLLAEKKYHQAEQAFLYLYLGAADEEQPMAGVYVAICRYMTKNYAGAIELLSRVRTDHPDFALGGMIRYWEGLCAYQMGDLTKAFTDLRVYEKLTKETKEGAALKQALVQAMQAPEAPLHVLTALYERFPAVKVIEETLLRKLRQQGLEAADLSALDTLFEHSWTKDALQMKLEQATPTSTRAYHVAVLLPFSVETWLRSSRKSAGVFFVWALYMGMLEAQRALAEEGIDVLLYPYDTQRNPVKTQEVIGLLAESPVDLIVGPLHYETISVVRPFAQQQGVAMLNPLSSNPRLSRHSGLQSWLFESDDLTRIAALGNQVLKEASDTSAVGIFCESLPRHIMACNSLVSHMKKAGKEVRFVRYLPAEEASVIRNSLVKVERVWLPDQDPEEEPEAQAGIIYRKGQGGRYAEQKGMWCAERWEIQPGEISHLFISGQDPSFLSHAISAVAERPDTISIITDERFLRMANIDLNQIEQLGARFLCGNYFESPSRAQDSFRESYFLRWGVFPDRYARAGYEMLWIFGRSMSRWEDDFMQALQINTQGQTGRLGTRLRYGTKKHDNQQVHLLFLEKGELKSQPLALPSKSSAKGN